MPYRTSPRTLRMNIAARCVVALLTTVSMVLRTLFTSLPILRMRGYPAYPFYTSDEVTVTIWDLSTWGSDVTQAHVQREIDAVRALAVITVILSGACCILSLVSIATSAHRDTQRRQDDEQRAALSEHKVSGDAQGRGRCDNVLRGAHGGSLPPEYFRSRESARRRSERAIGVSLMTLLCVSGAVGVGAAAMGGVVCSSYKYNFVWNTWFMSGFWCLVGALVIDLVCIIVVPINPLVGLSVCCGSDPVLVDEEYAVRGAHREDDTAATVAMAGLPVQPAPTGLPQSQLTLTPEQVAEMYRHGQLVVMLAPAPVAATPTPLPPAKPSDPLVLPERLLTQDYSCEECEAAVVPARGAMRRLSDSATEGASPLPYGYTPTVFMPPPS